MSVRVHRISTYFQRVNVDRALAIICIIAIVVVGWTSVNNSKNYQNFTNCTVDYLVQDRAASAATTRASRDLTQANNEANKTIPTLLSQVLKLNSNPTPTPDQIQEALQAIIATNQAFAKSNKKYEAYLKAIENNPRPPDPTKFCKEK